jgi:hypothetical protein
LDNGLRGEGGEGSAGSDTGLRAALQENAEVGGDSTHRGSLIGLLLGCAHGMSSLPSEWIEHKVDRDAISSAVDACAALVVSTGGSLPVIREQAAVRDAREAGVVRSLPPPCVKNCVFKVLASMRTPGHPAPAAGAVVAAANASDDLACGS